MEAKLRAKEIQAFANYKSADGTVGVTSTPGGLFFKNGLFIGGTVSAVSTATSPDSVTILGTGGNGYVAFSAQTVAPALGSAHIYADTTGKIVIGHSGPNAFGIVFNNVNLTATRTLIPQDKSGTLAMTNDNVSEFTNDAGYVAGPASAVIGRIATFNGTTGKIIQDSGILASAIALNTRVLTAGAGLTGGGDLTADRTFDVGAGLGITVNANDVALTTPGTLTVATTNAASGNHTHAITSSANPGAVASLLATDSSGYLRLVRLGIGTVPTQPLEVAGNAFINAATANLYMKDTSTGLQVSATGIINPQSGNTFRTTSFTSGVVGWNVSNDGTAEFNNVRIRGELAASVFKVSELSATAGTFGVFYSASTLTADCFTAPSVGGSMTLVAKNSDAGGMLFAVGDVLRIKAWTGAAIQDVWITVTSRANNGADTNYVGNLNSGATSAIFSKGTAVVDYGPSGTGFITLSTDGTVGSSPNLTMATHAGSPWSAFTTLLRLGNINGSYGYAVDTYGLGIGSGGASDPYFIATSASVRIGRGSTDYITFSATDAQFTNLIKMSGSNAAIALGSTPPTSATAGTGIWLDRTGLYALSSNTQNTAITSAGVTAGGGNVKLDGNGVSIAAQAAYDITTAIRWNRAGVTGTLDNSAIGRIYSFSSSSAGTMNLDVGTDSGTTAATANMVIRAYGNGGVIPTFKLTEFGSTGTNANTAYASLYRFGLSGTFAGLAVGNDGLPTHMLDVYGTGWFQSDLTVGAGGTGNTRAVSILNGGSGTTGVSSGAYVITNNNTSAGSAAAAFGTEIAITGVSGNSNTKATLYSSSSTYRLYGLGAGTVTTDANGDISITSDERLKTRIRQFRKGLDTIKKLEPILYRWNKKSGLDTKNDYVGFGARHTKKHLSEAVGKGRNGFNTMNDRAILAAAVNAIKELEQKYESLSRTIAA
jgi:hypothetical protein